MTKLTAVFIIASLLSALVSCSRSDTSETEELRALREEVKSLHAELEHQKTNPPALSTQPSPTAGASVSSPEFIEFMRVSRRMIVAIDKGITYDDFVSRLIEINAAAQEAYNKTGGSPPKAAIRNFVLALNDAQALWKVKMSLEKSSNIGVATIRLHKTGRGYGLVDDPPELGDRWSGHFPELVETYRLQDGTKDSPITPDNSEYTARYGPTMFLSRALPRVLEYAGQAFLELEKTQK